MFHSNKNRPDWWPGRWQVCVYKNAAHAETGPYFRSITRARGLIGHVGRRDQRNFRRRYERLGRARNQRRLGPSESVDSLIWSARRQTAGSIEWRLYGLLES